MPVGTTSGQKSADQCYALLMTTIQPYADQAPESPEQSGGYSPAEAMTAMSSHGYRLTSPRRAIITAALGQERPFTSEQLVAETVDATGDSGRSTVYRTLEILASLGILFWTPPGGRSMSLVHPTIDTISSVRNAARPFPSPIAQ
jgi:hypothetical protein